MTLEQKIAAQTTSELKKIAAQLALQNSINSTSGILNSRASSTFAMPIDQQEAAYKEIRRICRIAKNTGGTVSYSLGEMVRAGVSVSTIKKVIRCPLHNTQNK